MRLSMLPPSTLLYILVATTPVRSAVDLDFSSYPSSTQACLGDAAGVSGCAGETVTEENSCLCGNVGNFVINTAICIGGKGNTVMQAVWELLDSSCTETQTPLQVSEEQFFHYEIKKTVTSTVTTTSAGVVTTYTTTSTNTNTAADTATATSTSSSSSQASHDDVVASARIGAITASVAGTLAILCAVGIIILLKKWKKDKTLLREAQEAARGSGSGYRPGQDKPLLHPGDVTPGFASPRYGEGMFGVSVVEPPTPSHPGPMSPHTWPPAPPTELYDASSSGAQSQQRGVEPGSHVTHWPSPLTQNGGTMGSWCPSPLSAVPTSGGLPWPNVGTYHNHHNGGLSTVVESPMVGSHLSRNITGTIRSDVSRPDLSRQISGTSTARSSWAHIRQPQEELYELPGTEIRSPVEADSTPLPRRAPKRLSMAISPAAPPEYVAGGWTDPITDKPPENWI